MNINYISNTKKFELILNFLNRKFELGKDYLKILNFNKL